MSLQSRISSLITAIGADIKALQTATRTGQFFLTAAGLYPSTTNGPSQTKTEQATNKQNIYTLDFDPTTQEFAEVLVAMPSNWNGGTVTAEFWWTATGTSTNSVVWALQGRSYGDLETLDQAFGTEQVATDAHSATALQAQKSAATPAITLSGTPAASELVLFRVKRNPSDGSDTLAVDAMLIGVVINYTKVQLMAVAHDAATRFPASAGTVESTGGSRTFTHTPTGTPKGVIVVVWIQATSAPVTGVNYGGVALTLRADASDTSEAGRVQVWTLTDVDIPAGAQTVELVGTGASNHVAYCFTVTSATAHTTYVGSGTTNTTIATNPTCTVVTTAESLIYGGVHSGYIDVPTAFSSGSGYTSMDKWDTGSQGGAIQRRTNPVAAGNVVFNFVSAQSDDYCIAAAAIGELVDSRIPRHGIVDVSDHGIL